MYASSAFESEPMESEYLQAMDATEKEIVEKEDNQMKDNLDYTINKCMVTWTTFGVACGLACIYDDIKKINEFQFILTNISLFYSD